MAEPMNPVAPVTKARMKEILQDQTEGHYRREIYQGKVVALYGYND
jgi:hypothetical protein